MVKETKCIMCNEIVQANLFKNHVVKHFKPQFDLILPSGKPFPCPECGNGSR